MSFPTRNPPKPLFSSAHLAQWARMEEDSQRRQEAFAKRFINQPTTKKEPTMIKPTIGRVVWLWPCPATATDKGIAYSDKGMPLAATVAYVWGDRLVNLAAVDQNGRSFNLTSVLLLQGDEEYAPVGNYCEWMPYQKEQATRADSSADAAKADPRVGTNEFSIVGCNDIFAPFLESQKALRSSIPSDQPTQVTDDMVSRFLGWKLPSNFYPDCYISFDDVKARTNASWPTGTNLLDARQARAMLEHVLAKPAQEITQQPVQLTPFGFGGALNVLLLGGKVSRAGWNGKGMWVTLAGPSENTVVGHEKLWSKNNAKFAKDQPNGEVTVQPYFTIKNADNTISNWVPSTGDILALDWMTVQ